MTDEESTVRFAKGRLENWTPGPLLQHGFAARDQEFPISFSFPDGTFTSIPDGIPICISQSTRGFSIITDFPVFKHLYSRASRFSTLLMYYSSLSERTIIVDLGAGSRTPNYINEHVNIDRPQ